MTHPEMVKKLCKTGQKILSQLDPIDCAAMHDAIGIAGEAGEILDMVKKAAIYRQPYDVANLVEELGDLEFYMEHLRQCFGITREQTLEANILKLRKRYGAQFDYSDSAAKLRADKLEAAS